MDDKLYDQSRETHAEIKKDIAEADRDAAMTVAAANAVERDAAVNAAASEAVNRDAAEARAVDARIYANQAHSAAREMATERNILRDDLDYERAAASNNAFGFYMALAVLLAVLVFGGYWLYDRYYDQGNVIVAAPPPPATNNTIVTPSPAPSPSPVVTVPVPTPAPAENPAPQVNVPPPQIKVNITPPPSSSENQGTTGTEGNSGTNP